MKEKVLEAFQALGFQLEEMEELGYGFHYEGKHYLYMCSENDPDFLNITIPAVMDIDDKEDISAYHVMDKINSTLKYVKAYELYDSVWLFYERELSGDEDLKKVLSKMILHLEGGYLFLHNAMENLDEDYDNPSEVVDDETPSEVTDSETDNDDDVA